MIPADAPWPSVVGGVDARRPWPITAARLVVTSPPYLWKARYSDDPAEFGAGSLDGYLTDLVAVAEQAWRASEPGGWFVLNLGDTRLNTGGSGGQVTKAGQRNYRQDRGHGIEGQQWANVPHRAAELIRSATGWWLTGDVVWRKPTPILCDCSEHHLARNRRPGLQHESLFMFWRPGGEQTWNTDVLVEHRDPAAVATLAMLNRLLDGMKRATPAERRRMRELGIEVPGPERDAVRRLTAAGNRAVLGSVWDLPKHTSAPPWSETADDTKAFPDALCERLVRLLSNEGDLVVDPMAGYGTLGRVAMHLGRRAWCGDLFTGAAGEAAAAG